MHAARLRALLQGAVDGIISIDERGLIQTMNPAAEKMFGYAADEAVGQNVKILMPSPYRQEHDGYLSRYLQTGEKWIIGIGREVVGLRKNGTTFPMELSVAEACLGEERVFMGIVRDVSERKQAEEWFRLVVESAPNAIVAIDEAGQMVLVNSQTEKLFGRTRDELIGQPVEVLVPERFRARHPEYRASFTTSPQTRPMGVGRDLYGLRKDGSEFPVEIGLNPLRTGEGLFVLAAIVDITERKQAEIALRESETQLREQARVLEQAQVLVRDLEDRIILWSEGAARMYGWSRQEALGQISHALLRTAFSIPLDVIRAELEREGEWDGELVHHHKDGERFMVATHWVLYRDEQGFPRAILEVNNDITEQKRANEELRAMTQQLWQAAKLASVGELAASIAHELNNPLATVSLRIEAVLGRTPLDDPRRRSLEIIDQETKRMAALVANLLQFSRRSDDKSSTLDIREELSRAIELIQHHLSKRQVKVSRELAPDTPAIHADRQKLRQVFLNLLTNACDAMPEGGRLTLRSAPLTLDNGRPGVLIEFADTGTGIPAEHVQRVFDPFFTTKGQGQGTGLGLAICRRAVEEHRGTIHIQSELGVGTTVRMTLPLQDGVNVEGLRRKGSKE